MNTTTRHGSDIGIITVLAPELQAIQRALKIDNDKDRISGQGDLFWRKKLQSKASNANLDVVVHCQGFAQNVNASIAATKIIERYQPRLLILMGIAAGRKGKCKIGDVVIPRAIMDYTGGVAATGRIKPRPWIPLLPHAVMQCIQSFRFDPSKWNNYLKKIFSNLIIPPVGADSDLIAMYAENVAKTPELREAVIASGDLLLRDKDFLEQLADRFHEQIRIGEMEAAGFARACEARYPTTPWLVVRGVSDFGDTFKDDNFHKFASSSAAAYLHYFLTHGLDIRLFNGGSKPGPKAKEIGLEDSEDRISPKRTLAFHKSHIGGPPVATLVGRDDVVTKVHEAFKKFGGVVALVGPPGSGKSAIAHTVAIRCYNSDEPWKKRFSKVIWISAQPTWLSPLGIKNNVVHAKDSSDVFHEIAKAFGRPRLSTLNVREQLQILTDLLARHKTLLVLDSFESLKTDDFLLQLLRDVPQGSAILITSSMKDRTHQDCVLVSVDPLNRKGSLKLLQLLRTRIGIPKNARIDKEIYELIGGLPLALEWVVGQLENDDVSNILNGIRSFTGSVCEFLFENRIRPGLSKDDWKVLCAVAFFSSPGNLTGIGETSGIDASKIGNILRNLKRYFLIYDQPNQRLGVHGLTREFVLGHLNETTQDLNRMRQRFITWAVNLAQQLDGWEFDFAQYATLSDDIENLKAALELSIAQKSPSSEEIRSLATTVILMLHINGRWEVSATLCRTLLRLFPTGPINTDVRILLGRHHAHRREVREALDILAPAVEQSRQMGDLGRLSEATMRIGHTLIHQNLEEARDVLEEANDLAIQVGQTRTQVSVIGYLADVLIQLRQFDAAIDLLNKRPTTGTVQWDRAEAYLSCLLGDCYVGKGDYTHARQLYNQARLISKRWSDDRLGSWSLLGLATCDRRGDWATAALVIFCELGMAREAQRARSLLRELK